MLIVQIKDVVLRFNCKFEVYPEAAIFIGCKQKFGNIVTIYLPYIESGYKCIQANSSKMNYVNWQLQ